MQNYRMAKKLYGETLLKAVTNYDPNFIEKNKNIPEFQKELKEHIKEKLRDLRIDGLLDKDNVITEKAIEIASLSLYIEELEQIPFQARGELAQKKFDPHGVRDDSRPYKKGFRFRDINIHQTIKNVIKRGHKKINIDDVRVYNLRQVGSIEIIYCIDISSSMKGRKIKEAKKAGVALSYHAIQKKDKVGLLGFSTQVTKKTTPTHDFKSIINDITLLSPGGQTNISKALRETITLFSPGTGTKHVVLITDAIPTYGEQPIKQAVQAVQEAHDAGITVSVIAIDIDKEGEKIAETIISEGGGRLYTITSHDKIDHIILEDYYSAAIQH